MPDRIKFMLLGALAIMALAFSPATHAGERASYAAWFDVASGHLRTAASYLRTHNGDLAGLSVEQLADSLARIERGKVDLPAGKGMKSMLSQVGEGVKLALDQTDAGDLDKARQTLLNLRDMLFRIHQAAGLELFPDCIWQLTRQGPAIWRMRAAMPDLASKAGGAKALKAAADYVAQLKRCKASAPERLRRDATFQRLSGDALAALALVPETVEQNDPGRLIRIIRELRSLDNLLFFYFG